MLAGVGSAFLRKKFRPGPSARNIMAATITMPSKIGNTRRRMRSREVARDELILLGSRRLVKIPSILPRTDGSSNRILRKEDTSSSLTGDEGGGSSGVNAGGGGFAGLFSGGAGGEGKVLAGSS